VAPPEPASQVEEVVLDVPAQTESLPGRREPDESPGLERAVEEAALDGSVREDELERARMRFEPESEMAGAASEDLEPTRETSDLGIEMAIETDREGDRARPRRSKSTGSLLALLVLLAAGVAAVLFLRRGGPAEPVATAAVTPVSSPTPVAESAPSPPAASAAPAQPSAAAGVSVSPPLSGTRRPTAPPTRPTASPRPTSPPVRRSASQASRASWLDRAARDQKRATADRQARFAIQLELACEVPSLVEAWRHDRPAGTMWLLTTSFQGRTCFRVLWGRYSSREAARQALAAAPSFFSTPRNHPMVVAIR
jgi:hypothetical protein